MSETPTPMTSHRPYLLRALYEWIADNDMTPHLLVDATRAGVQVPVHAVNDGQIVLNVAARAVSHLNMGNDAISFSARFGGVSHSVLVPVSAVLAIYSRETGQGMVLSDEALGGEAMDVDDDSSREAGAGRPTLSAVPSAHEGDEPEPSSGEDGNDGDDGGPAPSHPRRGAHLRVIK